MTLTPPPEKFFATINDIPDETTATINELLNDIDARQFFNTVVTTLNKYSIGSNNYRIVPSVSASSYYALQNHDKEDDPIAKTIMYDIEGLPVLAELLANAVMLTDDTVKQRLTWLESNETTLKLTKEMNNKQQLK
ncbi:6642_t:CDS:2, partial [Rhizophagus irregularis]